MDIDLDVIDSRKASVISEAKVSRRLSEHEPATFEEAITETKFGKFNIVLALLAIPASLCVVFDTSTMSYTFVAAQCDLELSLSDKGLLNAVTYGGMITSAVIWGFLFDVLGRKRLLVIGFLIDSIFVFTSSLTQNIALLLVTKYLQGFIINGPFAALSSYMSEFHSAKYRPNCQLIIGSCNSFGTVLLPMIAWGILPNTIDFSIFNYNFHSWNIFLLITGLPAFITGLMFILLPESPKFLMSRGENDKALEVFRKVYSINTGQPKDTYPIRKLVDETKLKANNQHGGQVTAQRSTVQTLKEGFRQIKPLFFPPYLLKVILTCAIMLFIVMGLNMLRLWLPQIFQTITDYQVAHNGSTASLCTMLEIITPSNNASSDECVVNTDNSTVYINSIIVGCTAICGYVVAGSVIRLIGKKKMVVGVQCMTAAACVGMYFSKQPVTALISASLFMAAGSLSNNVMISIVVDLFPTTLRTLAIALGMMIGRCGAMMGNFIFPYLLESGCEPPFFVVSGFMLAAAALSLTLPNTDMQALQ
ncbi:hypothetical protein GWI33_011708 [Rhynchophorus ferrugineus]|uniref:Major facilitator superfamily (MFS) profile domain-containing protein n=1 Tax=Rhynchophorus ferrugineus TaxID=354439 RepID=A0A834IRN3_RHYFE|nr:hypothetical protein GWI33_011708 [Rhynchophorus ferrugineus]